MANNTKVLAIQVSEDFHAAIKRHLKKNKISLKDFLTGLITPVLDDIAPEPVSPAEDVTDDITTPTEDPAATAPDPAPTEDAAVTEDAATAADPAAPAKKMPAKKSAAGRKKK